MAFGKQPPPENLPRYGAHNSIRDVFGGGNRSGKSDGGPRNGPFFRYYDFPLNKEVNVIFHGALHENVIVEPDGTPMRREAPFVRFMQHWHNTKRRFTTCSGGPDYWNQEKASSLCAGCQEFFNGRKKVNGRWENTGPVGRSEAFAFSITVLETFYMVATNRVNPRTNLPYEEPAQIGDPRLPKSKAELDKMQSVHGMRFIYKTSRTGFGNLYGADNLPPLSGIDEQLRRYCGACGAQDTFDPEAGICSNCGAGENERIHLHSPKVLKIKSVVAGQPKQPGQRPPSALILVGYRDIPADINPELLEAIPLVSCTAPTPPEKQAEVYGYAPKVTAQGHTGVEDAAAEDDDFPY